MKTAIRPRHIGAIALLLPLLAVTPASAQNGDAPGRFAMQPTEGGFYRLDTHTGAVSICRQRPGGPLTCEPAQDATGIQKEMEELRTENRRLKEDVKRLEEIAGLGDKPGAGRSTRPQGPGFGLPSEEDVDKALSYVERMIKKFRDKWRELEGNDQKRTTPL